MARFLLIWRSNPVAPWPTDPVEYSKFIENSFAAMDDLVKKGLIKEMGSFLDGNSGYVICEGEGADIYRANSMFLPYWESEVYEIISWEKTKEITAALMKAQIEAAKK